MVKEVASCAECQLIIFKQRFGAFVYKCIEHVYSRRVVEYYNFGSRVCGWMKAPEKLEVVMIKRLNFTHKVLIALLVCSSIYVIHAYKKECFPRYGVPKNKMQVTYTKREGGQECVVSLSAKERGKIRHFLMRWKDITHGKYTRTSIIDDGFIEKLLASIKRNKKAEAKFYDTFEKVLQDFKGDFVGNLFTQLGIPGNI